MRQDISRRKELLKCIMTLVISIVFFKCVVVPVYIPTASMEPTIKINSLHFAYRLPFLIGNYEVNRGDIVVFKASDGRMLCKRVIGIGGDEVYIHDGTIYLNCEPLIEPYLDDDIDTEAETEAYTVPEGKLFLLGDNRRNSKDARFWCDPYIDTVKIYARIIK